MTKLRSDSTLAQLTEDQRDQLYDWIISQGRAKAIELAAQSIDEGGLNLTLHRTTLDRFFEREQKERQARELAELAAAAESETLPERIDQLIHAARVKLAQAAYELSKTVDDPENFDRLERALHHIEIIKIKREELTIRKQELELQRERFTELCRQWRFNTARAVLCHLPELMKVARDQSLDNEEKIWAAHDICFGTQEESANAMTHSATLKHALPTESAPIASPTRTPGAEAGVPPDSTLSQLLKAAV